MNATQIQSDPTQFDANFAGHRGLTFVRGEGSFVFDAEGRPYFDGTSMYGVASVGHGHPQLAQAIADQAGQLMSCFASFGNDKRALLQAKLACLLAPMDRIFLCNSGTEAVEAAIKLARSTTGRTGTVALTGAFHGRTLGALAATFRGKHRDAFAPLPPDFTHVRAGDLDALDTALTDEVALLILEPVQGEGGVRPLDSAYLQGAAALCEERGVLLCVDEVQTGVGRTGRWFGYQHAGITPDMVCLAKGLGGGFPIGALAFRGDRVTIGKGSHGSTFGGNPLACAAALQVLEIFEREALVHHVADVGQRALDLLQQRLGHSDRVRAIRGRGFLIGIELKAASVPIQRALQARGFLTLGAGPRVLRLLPPLTATWPELEQLCQAIVEEILR